MSTDLNVVVREIFAHHMAKESFLEPWIETKYTECDISTRIGQ